MRARLELKHVEELIDHYSQNNIDWPGQLTMLRDLADIRRKKDEDYKGTYFGSPPTLVGHLETIVAQRGLKKDLEFDPKSESLPKYVIESLDELYQRMRRDLKHEKDVFDKEVVIHLDKIDSSLSDAQESYKKDKQCLKSEISCLKEKLQESISTINHLEKSLKSSCQQLEKQEKQTQLNEAKYQEKLAEKDNSYNKLNDDLTALKIEVSIHSKELCTAKDTYEDKVTTLQSLHAEQITDMNTVIEGLKKDKIKLETQLFEDKIDKNQQIAYYVSVLKKNDTSLNEQKIALDNSLLSLDQERKKILILNENIKQLNSELKQLVIRKNKDKTIIKDLNKALISKDAALSEMHGKLVVYENMS